MSNKPSNGFTLVELLVVSPLILLLVGGIIAAMVTITGNSLAAREKNSLVLDLQSSLDSLEADITKAVEFEYTIPASTVESPQSVPDNNGDAIVSTASGPFIVRSAAITESPYSDTRELVYIYDTTGSCPADLSSYPYYSVFYVYFIDSNGTLWRRVITDVAPTSPSQLCGNPWQRDSCLEANLSDPNCDTIDSRMADNISSMSLTYYEEPDDSSAMTFNDSTHQDASTVEVQLTAQKEVAGETVSTTRSLRATSLNL